MSYLDDLLFRERHRARALLNLGGIANVTILPPSREWRAPAGVRHRAGEHSPRPPGPRVSGGTLAYDRDGRLAGAGEVDEAFLSEVVAQDAYFGAPAPKTTGPGALRRRPTRSASGSRRRHGA